MSLPELRSSIGFKRGIVAMLRSTLFRNVILPDHVLEAQLRAARKGYASTFVGTVIVTLLLVIALPEAVNRWVVGSAALALIILSLANLTAWHREWRQGWHYTNPKRSIKVLTIVSLATALLWGTLLGTADYHAPANWELLISCTLVGVICVGTLNVATVPQASIGFLVGSLLTGFVNVIVIAEAPLGVLVALVVFIALLTRSVLAVSHSSFDAVQARDSLATAAGEHERLAIQAEASRLQHRAAELDSQASLENRLLEERRIEISDLASRFERTVADAVLELAMATDAVQKSTISLAADSISDATGARRTATVASEIERAAQAMHDTSAHLNRSVEEVGNRVDVQSALAAEAVSRSSEAQESFLALVEEASRIGDIVALITEVARQTNLLALNATIEASRAGPEGRGFAVVASEVKLLAGQTRHAADDIALRVQEIQKRVSLAVASVSVIAGHLTDVSSIARAVTAAVSEQQRIAASIEFCTNQAADGTGMLHDNIADGAVRAGRAQALAVDVAESTNLIVTQVNTLKAATNEMLAELRAA